jgi:hypothetical protein
MTLLKPGKLQELTEEIAKPEIAILALQETRWPGKGQINKKDYILYYSGSKEKTGQAGTGKQAKQAQENRPSRHRFLTH